MIGFDGEAAEASEACWSCGQGNQRVYDAEDAAWELRNASNVPVSQAAIGWQAFHAPTPAPTPAWRLWAVQAVRTAAFWAFLTALFFGANAVGTVVGRAWMVLAS